MTYPCLFLLILGQTVHRSYLYITYIYTLHSYLYITYNLGILEIPKSDMVSKSNSKSSNSTGFN